MSCHRIKIVTVRYHGYDTPPLTSIKGTAHQLRSLIYNGDVDIVCNFLGDQEFGYDVANITGLKVMQNRTFWLYDEAIAGFAEMFENFDGKFRTVLESQLENFAVLTVSGAGHFVPMDRSGPALQMIHNFVHNTGDYGKPSGIDVAPLIIGELN